MRKYIFVIFIILIFHISCQKNNNDTISKEKFDNKSKLIKYIKDNISLSRTYSREVVINVESKIHYFLEINENDLPNDNFSEILTMLFYLSDPKKKDNYKYFSKNFSLIKDYRIKTFWADAIGFNKNAKLAIKKYLKKSLNFEKRKIFLKNIHGCKWEFHKKDIMKINISR